MVLTSKRLVDAQLVYGIPLAKLWTPWKSGTSKNSLNIELSENGEPSETSEYDLNSTVHKLAICF